MSALLEVEALRVRIDGRDLLDIDEMRVDSGELFVIVGKAGSGKSLFAAALCGDVGSSGKVRVEGQVLEGPPSRRARLGLSASVRDGQRVTGCTVVEALQLAAGGGPRADQALQVIPQLASRSDLAAELLSGGEQQLLQVACAWCAAPRVLVLDSPTVGLAADAEEVVRSLAVREASAGVSVIWLEQDQRAAPGAQTSVLINGKLSKEQLEPSSGSQGSAAESPPGPHRTH